MAISESWLNSSIPDSFISIENYSVYRKDRLDKIGGGVALYVDQKYVHSVLKLPTESESLQIVVNLTNQLSVTIIVTYKPPTVSPAAYLQQLSDIIKSVNSKELVILGDINMDWSDNLSKSLKATASKLGLSQLIKNPTRICKTRNSILDLIFTNQPAKYGIAGIINTSVSDHSFIFAVRKCLKKAWMSQKQRDS